MTSIDMIVPGSGQKTSPKRFISISPLRALKKFGRFLCQMASTMTPHPRTIEVRMSNGTTLTNIPTRVWDRHSALISARYESQRR